MKLIAIDLDGTLINKGQISQENSNAIKKAQQQGIEVTIATGRAHFDARKICEKAGICAHIISCNGAMIHLKDGQNISATTIAKNDVEKILTWLENKNFYYEVYTDKKIYRPANGKEILELEMAGITGKSSIKAQWMIKAMCGQAGLDSINGYQDFIDTDEAFYKVLACSFDKIKYQHARENFLEMKHLSLDSSADSNFELVDKKVSKGNALEILAASLRIPFDQVMAIGDSPNDISMLQKVKYSVAMGNAAEEIKELCNFVTRSYEQDGVAHAIHQALATNWSSLELGNI